MAHDSVTSVPAEDPTPLRWADQRWFYRTFEILPGAIAWFFLLSPIFLSLFAPAVVAYFIIAFDLFWLLKSARMSYGLVRGYNRLGKHKKLDWGAKLAWLSNLDAAQAELEQKIINRKRRVSTQASRQLTADLREIQALQLQADVLLDPNEVMQLVIMPIYRENIDTVRPSMQSVLDCAYDPKQIIFVLAYEERGGAEDLAVATTLEREFKDKFYHFEKIMHTVMPGEIKGKGGNITHAGREILKYIESKKIKPINVIVTTLDADNRPHKQYFNYLSYKYCSDPNRRHKSYQPIPMFFNNIWDVPAPTRIVATSNSFWVIIEATRPHRLRNFSAHAQSLQTLIDTDFWSVTTIVEDGHQYWRTFFTYDGDHFVEPIYLPIYQDAVLASTFMRTLKAQFLQLRRWAYGASDFPYVVQNCVKNSKIKLSTKLVQIWRLFEGHFSWATAPLILLYVAWLPLYLNKGFNEEVLAHQLPVIASRILTLAMIGLFVTVWTSLLSLPPRPARYRRGKYILMLAQWVLSPVVAICFGAFAALNAQTRLMIGKRLEVFQVTEKVVRK